MKIRNTLFTLALTTILNTSGWTADNNFSDETPVGSIISFAGREAPAGWAICDGRRTNSAEHGDLYRVIGITYTPAILVPPREDGEFCLPDLRSRVTVGFDTREAQRLVANSNVLGRVGGEETHALTVPEIPGHDHAISVSPLTQLGGQYPGDIIVPPTEIRAAAYSSTARSGEDQPHNNMQPYMVLNCIIKHSGGRAAVENNVLTTRIVTLEETFTEQLAALEHRLDNHTHDVINTGGAQRLCRRKRH